LEGSLADTSLDRILHACHQHLLTATLRVRAFGGEGRIELRAGAVDQAVYGDVRGDDAIAQMRRLGDGIYELTQQLPDLSGELGAAAQFEGDISEVTLVSLMRHCEDNALTCKITLINDFDRGEITYRAGEIQEVRLNGEIDDDNILDLVRFEHAKFRVSALPLDLDIEGWPSLRREPTAPFRLRPPEPAPDAARPAAEPARIAAAAPTATTAAGEEEVVDMLAAPGTSAALWFGIGAVTALAALGAAFVIAAFVG
jgi:hypothetical protein